MAAQYERPWRRIAADLRAKIHAGRWQPGDRLPPISRLQEEYGVAKGTITNALNQLREEGLIHGVAGSGIYVLEVVRERPQNAGEAPPTGEASQGPDGR